MNDGIRLRALDGSNPLAFLAALGTLRILTNKMGRGVRMRWVRDGAWRPEVGGVEVSEDRFSDLVLEAISLPLDESRTLGADITVSPDEFNGFVRACEGATKGGDRRASDFAAAFGSEVRVQPRNEERIQYTELCFMTGSGHQHFLGTMEALRARVHVEHVKDALFGNWRRDKGNSMRWDPQDAAEYALRWGDPSVEGASAVWGANLLAAEALPLFGAFAVRGARLGTTGFRTTGEWPQFSWPIWTEWVGLDMARSLIGLEELRRLGVGEDEEERKRDGNRRRDLRERGVAEVYRAARVRIGKGANFKVSFRPAVAV